MGVYRFQDFKAELIFPPFDTESCSLLDKRECIVKKQLNSCCTDTSYGVCGATLLILIKANVCSQNIYKFIFQKLLQNGKACVKLSKLDVR